MITAEWTLSADMDFDVAWTFLAARSPEAAQRFAGRVVETVERLQQHPEAGRVVGHMSDLADIRCFSLRPHHQLYYLVTEGKLVVLRLWDARQDPQTLTFDP